MSKIESSKMELREEEFILSGGRGCLLGLIYPSKSTGFRWKACAFSHDRQDCCSNTGEELYVKACAEIDSKIPWNLLAGKVSLGGTVVTPPSGKRVYLVGSVSKLCVSRSHCAVFPTIQRK